MFKITQVEDAPHFNQPEIASALVQKLAVASQIDERNFDEKLFARVEYKNMLKSIKQGFDRLDDKYLVDTIYALGRLHKGQTKDNMAKQNINKYGDFKFF